MLLDESRRVHSCNNSLCKRQNGPTCSLACVSECVPRGVLFMLLRLWALKTSTAEDRDVWTAEQMTLSLKYSNHS